MDERKSRAAHSHSQEIALRALTSSRAADDRQAPPSDALSLDGDVRRMVHGMVGSLENVVGSLHGIVGNLRELVSQIDAVTEKIDKCCTERAAQRRERRNRYLPSPPTLAVAGFSTTVGTKSSYSSRNSIGDAPCRKPTASVCVQTPYVHPGCDVDLCFGAHGRRHQSQDVCGLFTGPVVAADNAYCTCSSASGSRLSAQSPCAQARSSVGDAMPGPVGRCSYVTGRDLFDRLHLPAPSPSGRVALTAYSRSLAEAASPSRPREDPRLPSARPQPWLISSDWPCEPVPLPPMSSFRRRRCPVDRLRPLQGPSRVEHPEPRREQSPDASPHHRGPAKRSMDLLQRPSPRHVARMYAQTRGCPDEGTTAEAVPRWADADIQHWQLMMENKCGSVGSLTPQMDWSYLGLTEPAVVEASEDPDEMLGEGFPFLPGGALNDPPCLQRLPHDPGDCLSACRLSQRRLSDRSEQGGKLLSDWRSSSEGSSIKSSDDEDDSRAQSPIASPYSRHKVYQARSRHVGTVSPLVQRKNGQSDKPSVFVARSKFVVSQAAGKCDASQRPEAAGATSASASPCGIATSYCGIYESAMEAELEQLSEDELDASDFSDVEADAGSDLTNRSLTSCEAEEGSLAYDRSVNTWKSYTMTHIDSDDALSETASDVNENFLDISYSKPAFDEVKCFEDVKSKFSDIHLPALAY